MKNGFTLVELLIALLIIGIGLFTIVPKLTEKSIGKDKYLNFFDKLIEEHYKIAKKEHKPVYFKGFLGSENIVKYNGKVVKIPDLLTINSIEINDRKIEKLEFKIYVYPDGYCDYFKLRLSNDKVIESIPLFLKTKYYKNINE